MKSPIQYLTDVTGLTEQGLNHAPHFRIVVTLENVLQAIENAIRDGEDLASKRSRNLSTAILNNTTKGNTTGM